MNLNFQNMQQQMFQPMMTQMQGVQQMTHMQEQDEAPRGSAAATTRVAAGSQRT